MAGIDQKLAGIRILWRAPDTADLWGLPYDLRPEQTPYDIFKASSKPHPTRGFLTSIADWVWLGQPGWWGHLTRAEQTAIVEYLKKHKSDIPQNALEYSIIGESLSESSNESYRLPSYYLIGR